MPHLGPVATDIIRSLIILQLMFCLIGLVILSAVKRVYYTTHKSCILMVTIGVMVFCVYASQVMWYRMGEPLGWQAAELSMGASFVDLGLFCSFVKHKFFGSSL